MRHNIRNMDCTMRLDMWETHCAGHKVVLPPLMDYTMRLDMSETHCAGHKVFLPPLTYAVYRDMIRRGESEDKDRTRGV